MDEFKTRKARKRHRCDTCGRFINAGEMYEYKKWLDCDGLNIRKDHQSCDAFYSYIIDRNIDSINETGEVYPVHDYASDDDSQSVIDAWEKIRTSANSFDEIKYTLPKGESK